MPNSDLVAPIIASLFRSHLYIFKRMKLPCLFLFQRWAKIFYILLVIILSNRPWIVHRIVNRGISLVYWIIQHISLATSVNRLSSTFTLSSWIRALALQYIGVCTHITNRVKLNYNYYSNEYTRHTRRILNCPS